jgi:hypothetical protein
MSLPNDILQLILEQSTETLLDKYNKIKTRDEYLLAYQAHKQTESRLKKEFRDQFEINSIYNLKFANNTEVDGIYVVIDYENEITVRKLKKEMAPNGDYVYRSYSIRSGGRDGIYYFNTQIGFCTDNITVSIEVSFGNYINTIDYLGGDTDEGDYFGHTCQ